MLKVISSSVGLRLASRHIAAGALDVLQVFGARHEKMIIERRLDPSLGTTSKPTTARVEIYRE